MIERYANSAMTEHVYQRQIHPLPLMNEKEVTDGNGDVDLCRSRLFHN